VVGNDLHAGHLDVSCSRATTIVCTSANQPEQPNSR
jgi:hypothetical protein